MATLTWLGHASFRLDTDGGKRIYVDPWLSGPTCPDSEREPERADVIVVTHGHGDHVGDAVGLQKSLGCKVIGMVELMGWFGANGVPEDALVGFNKGGTHRDRRRAVHDDERLPLELGADGTYAGEPAGVVIRAEGTSIYFAGDTCVFGDMQLIARLYQPQVAVLPIGDHYTMGPDEAALALELLGNPRCVPGHWGTFPLLTGTPDALAKLTKAQVDRIEPGDTVEL